MLIAVRSRVLVALAVAFAGPTLLLSGARATAVPLRTAATDPAIVTVYAARDPRGVMVTSGGWPYCHQVRKLAERTGYTLVCGRFSKDGYTDFPLRSERHVDWGNPAYLSSFARRIVAVHARVGGDLVLIGVSYSGFGVATLASHHPELRPDRVIVLDSYLDLVARRAVSPDSYPIAREIDLETGGSEAELRRRSVSVPGLVRLVRGGTDLTVIWSISADEDARYRGATCNETANAGTLAKLAVALRRPVKARVTELRHGVVLWHYGASILAGRSPGREVVFQPDGVIPAKAVC